jgi:GTP-binding protein
MAEEGGKKEEKKLTNTRSSTADVTRRLSAMVRFSLEDALDFISADELVEIAPQNFRMRKRELTTGERARRRRDGLRARD